MEAEEEEGVDSKFNGPGFSYFFQLDLLFCFGGLRNLW